MNRIFLFIILSFPFTCFSQTDTILTFQEYFENILKFHPLAKKANLQIDLAEAERLAAKGFLDPKITANWNQKNFDEKLYYRQYRGKLMIPTPLGIDLVGGYENTEGVFLNPQDKTDDFGLWNVGIEANVLQGLIVNERRTALQQAEVFQKMAANEQQILLNELLYEAATAYLKWQQYFQFNQVLAENISIANTYFENTKQTFFNGEKTAMDTLEASISYQDAFNLLLNNEVQLVKKRQNAENFLWFNDAPVFLQTQTQPENFADFDFRIVPNLDIENVLENHPALLAYENKFDYFQIEQKLKREKLKPKLKVKYNPLIATSEDAIRPNYSTSDFKWGFDFSVPIPMRKERAEVQKGEIKLQETSLDLENKRNELKNKLEANRQQQTILRSQIIILNNNIEGYRRLLEGENELFRLGESSVFLLNKRQEKFINGQLKLIKLRQKLQQEILNYLYLSNGLVN